MTKINDDNVEWDYDQRDQYKIPLNPTVKGNPLVAVKLRTVTNAGNRDEVLYGNKVIKRSLKVVPFEWLNSLLNIRNLYPSKSVIAYKVLTYPGVTISPAAVKSLEMFDFTPVLKKDALPPIPRFCGENSDDEHAELYDVILKNGELIDRIETDKNININSIVAFRKITEEHSSPVIRVNDDMKPYSVFGHHTVQDLKTNEFPKQQRYTDSDGLDWIDKSASQFDCDEFRGAMKFTIGKYMERLGKKDSIVNEVRKIADYAQRWLQYEESQR
jgi:hypothetical protein